MRGKDEIDGLNDRERIFVAELLADRAMSGTQAAIRAGYSPASAMTQASKLLHRPKVAAYIEAGIREREERTGVTADRVVLELARIAFATPAEVASWSDDGMIMLRSDDLDANALAAIKEIKATRTVRRGKDGSETETTDKRVVMHDKLGALDLLARHTGVVKPVGNIVYEDHSQVAALNVAVTPEQWADALKHMAPLIGKLPKAPQVIEGE